jgi:CBS domain-containing protein
MAAELDLFIVKPTDSLRTAIEKIDRNKYRVVVVVDEGRVLGTVSDGDIRRAYMHEVLPIAPVSQIMQLNPHVTLERDRKKRHAQAVRDRVTVLPVVDEDNRLLDIELAYEPFED